MDREVPTSTPGPPVISWHGPGSTDALTGTRDNIRKLSGTGSRHPANFGPSYSNSPGSIMGVWEQVRSNLDNFGKIRKIRVNYRAHGYPVIRASRKNSPIIFGLPGVDYGGLGTSPVKFGQ